MANEFTIEARPLTAREFREWGIFISHSSDSGAHVEELCSVLDRFGISYFCDTQIEVGSTDFAEDIMTMVRKSVAAVVVISKGALKSQWVNFEIGMLTGLNEPIYLYDPDNLLEDIHERFHYDQYYPAYRDVSALAQAVRGEKLFYSLFNNETKDLTAELFRDKVDEHIIPVMFELTVPGLSRLDKSLFKVSALIINFGNFTKCRHRDDSVCSQTREDITDDVCDITGLPCCMNVNPDPGKSIECVLLNHPWEKTNVNGDTIEMILPLHRTMGTTFKLFFDTEYGEIADKLFALFEPLGFNPSLSKSGNQNRIYISLKSVRGEGVFRLKDDFSNNFLCPGVARQDR